jgi:hypothetical protein
VNRRTLLMLLTSLLAAASVLWMQRKFEAGDERSALGVVQGYRPHGVSIPELIAARHPGRPVEWSTATESACYQHVRVHAVVVEPAGVEPEMYAFSVDINGPVIHPANEPARALMAGLDQPPPAASLAPSASAAPSTSAAPSASATK